MVDFRLKGAGGTATAKRFRTPVTYLEFCRFLDTIKKLQYAELRVNDAKTISHFLTFISDAIAPI
jgi:hypothetical protein